MTVSQGPGTIFTAPNVWSAGTHKTPELRYRSQTHFRRPFTEIRHVSHKSWFSPGRILIKENEYMVLGQGREKYEYVTVW
jgi:hypothetical protein